MYATVVDRDIGSMTVEMIAEVRVMYILFSRASSATSRPRYIYFELVFLDTLKLTRPPISMLRGCLHGVMLQHKDARPLELRDRFGIIKCFGLPETRKTQ